MVDPQNPWLTLPTHSGLVPVPLDPSQSSLLLYLSAAGPPRRAGEPVVIIEAGLYSSSNEWVAVQRLLSSHVRCFTYDRAGYGQSPEGPYLIGNNDESSGENGSSQAPTAEQRAKELRGLLSAAGIDPPWILVGHSYGGLLVREFLRQNPSPENIVGMVIVDSWHIRSRLPEGWNDMLGDHSYKEVIGLESGRIGILSDKEWDTIRLDDVKNEKTGNEERKHMNSSWSALDAKLPMDKGPYLGRDARLSVIFCDKKIDMTKVLTFGEKMGLGNEKARKALKNWLQEEGLENDHRWLLALASKGMGRFVDVKTLDGGAGKKVATHNVQFVAPEIVAQEVLWVLKSE